MTYFGTPITSAYSTVALIYTELYRRSKPFDLRTMVRCGLGLVQEVGMLPKLWSWPVILCLHKFIFTRPESRMIFTCVERSRNFCPTEFSRSRQHRNCWIT